MEYEIYSVSWQSCKEEGVDGNSQHTRFINKDDANDNKKNKLGENFFSIKHKNFIFFKTFFVFKRFLWQQVFFSDLQFPVGLHNTVIQSTF